MMHILSHLRRLRRRLRRPRPPATDYPHLNESAALHLTKQARSHMVIVRRERVQQAVNTRNDQRELRRVIRQNFIEREFVGRDREESQ